MRSTQVHYRDAHGEHWGRVDETEYGRNWLRCVETDRGARYLPSVEAEFGRLEQAGSVTRPNLSEARPWCGAPRDLGGQQPCPIKTPCDAGTCRIGSAVGAEVYRAGTAPNTGGEK